MKILVSGGTGYIGSHTCVELLNKGYDVVAFDNLYNSKIDVVDRVEKITGKKLIFYKADMLDKESMRPIFEEHKFDAVIHFAALKAVGESVQKPLAYYKNNISGSLNLCELMNEYGCKRIIFSSSATVYGAPKTVPITEDFPLSTTNPYGSTKLMLERIFSDFCVPDPEWSVVLLRYFNPIGAHESGLLGESPNGIPNNLMPYIAQVAAGKLECLGVFGNDYDTPDGTGVRDYIHVVDLAKGHVNAVEKVTSSTGVNIYNLGTGIGYSVLDIVKAFEAANGIKIPYVIKPRRAGDIAICYANPGKAKRELGWEAKYDLERMCKDSWNFTKKSLGLEQDGFMADLITFVTEEGQVIRGSVMGAFEDDLSGKNYVIYTDNSVNETGNYNIFAASYDPEQEEEQILIHAIETEAEWQRIELMLQKLSNGPEGYGEQLKYSEYFE